MKTEQTPKSPLPWVKSTLCGIAISTPSKLAVWHHGSGFKTEHPLPIVEFPSKEISEDEAKANRDFVLRAVNSHDVLVESLKGITASCEGRLPADSSDSVSIEAIHIMRANEALRKAKEKK